MTNGVPRPPFLMMAPSGAPMKKNTSIATERVNDTYKNFFLRLVGKRPERSLEVKEVIMSEVEPQHAVELLQDLRNTIAAASNVYNRRWRPLRLLPCKQMQPVAPALSAVVDYLCNSSDAVVINLLNKYPFEPLRRDLPDMLTTTDSILNRINP